MLTPKDIEEVAFKRVLSKGYLAQEVDVFLDAVLKDYTHIYTENAELLKKIEVLMAKLVEYRENEDQLKETLLDARKMSESVIRDAKSRAERIITDAENTAAETRQSYEKMIADLRRQVELSRMDGERQIEALKSEVRREREREEKSLEQLRREASHFRSELLERYKDHINRISEIPHETEITVADAAAPVLPENNEAIRTAAPVPAVPSETAAITLADVDGEGENLALKISRAKDAIKNAAPEQSSAPENPISQEQPSVPKNGNSTLRETPVSKIPPGALATSEVLRVNKMLGESYRIRYRTAAAVEAEKRGRENRSGPPQKTVGEKRPESDTAEYEIRSQAVKRNSSSEREPAQKRVMLGEELTRLKEENTGFFGRFFKNKKRG